MSLRDVEKHSKGKLTRTNLHAALNGAIPYETTLRAIGRALSIPWHDLQDAYDETVLWRRALLERTNGLTDEGRRQLDAYLDLLLAAHSAPED
jgi:hypothetical protein